MAKNYVQAGGSISLPAPTGGSVAGVPQVIGALAVMPLQSGVKGTQITYRTCDVWNVPAAAGLKAGAKVSVLNGALVAETAGQSSRPAAAIPRIEPPGGGRHKLHRGLTMMIRKPAGRPLGDTEYLLEQWGWWRMDGAGVPTCVSPTLALMHQAVPQVSASKNYCITDDWALAIDNAVARLAHRDSQMGDIIWLYYGAKWPMLRVGIPFAPLLHLVGA